MVLGQVGSRPWIHHELKLMELCWSRASVCKSRRKNWIHTLMPDDATDPLFAREVEFTASCWVLEGVGSLIKQVLKVLC